MTDLLTSDDPVGTAQIAERLGVTKGAIEQWRWARKLNPFPPPSRRVGNSDAWPWAQVVEWCEATKRRDLLANYQPDQTQEAT